MFLHGLLSVMKHVLKLCDMIFLIVLYTSHGVTTNMVLLSSVGKPLEYNPKILPG